VPPKHWSVMNVRGLLHMLRSFIPKLHTKFSESMCNSFPLSAEYHEVFPRQLTPHCSSLRSNSRTDSPHCSFLQSNSRKLTPHCSFLRRNYRQLTPHCSFLLSNSRKLTPNCSFLRSNSASLLHTIVSSNVFFHI
jgi:hypothetical protein